MSGNPPSIPHLRYTGKTAQVYIDRLVIALLHFNKAINSSSRRVLSRQSIARVGVPHVQSSAHARPSHRPRLLQKTKKISKQQATTAHSASLACSQDLWGEVVVHTERNRCSGGRS
ncbi:unnamed protein product [Ectocarpus sp. 12 AP-2014]